MRAFSHLRLTAQPIVSRDRVLSSPLQALDGSFGVLRVLHPQISPLPAVILVIFDLVTEKGYCLVEFEKKEEAELAIAEMDGSQLLEQEISVTWAFVRGAFVRL